VISRVRGVSYYLISIIVFILIGTETLVRVFHLARPLPNLYRYSDPDPHLPYRPRPHSREVLTSDSGEFTIEYRHNSLGFRDIEHTFRKSADISRILTLGDSFTYGEGAAFESTYPYQLEKTLNLRQGHPPVEVIKAGIYRFFPEAERILLQYDGLKFHPDLIVVEFTTNDVIDTYLGIDAVHATANGNLLTSQARRLGSWGTWLYIHSHSARLLLSKYLSWKYQKSFRIDWPEIYKAAGYYENSWEKIESEFDQMVRLARQDHCKIVFFYLPDDLSQDHSRINQRLLKWSNHEIVPFVDLTPAMRAAALHERLYWPKDGHCTPAGYKVISDTLCKDILQSGLVP
jgi:lysophospholipase L1-like esterase